MMLKNTVQSDGGGTLPGTMQPATAPGVTLLLTRLSRAVYRRATEARLGMSLKAYMALSNLRDHDHVSQQALGDALHLDPNNCVLLLNMLENSDLVVRRRDRHDRRRHIVELTPAGRLALERADGAIERIEAEVLAPLDPEERATLSRLLLRAVESHEPHD